MIGDIDASLVERGLLIPVDEAGAWEEEDIPHEERGVRLDWVTALVRHIHEEHNRPLQRAFGEEQERYERALAQQRASVYRDNVPWVEAVLPAELALVELTTRALVADYVVPLTERLRAPLLARVPSRSRGRPTVFLSHTWDAVALALPGAGRHGTLDAFGPGVAGLREEYVWLDIVCYNQHRLSPGAIASDMESLVRGIGSVAFAVTTVPLFDRIWCLHELVSATRNECRTRFCVAPGYRTDKRIMVNDFFRAFSSVANARATVPEDYERILAEFTSRFGSVEEADRYVRELMRSGMGAPWFELYGEPS